MSDKVDYRASALLLNEDQQARKVDSLDKGKGQYKGEGKKNKIKSVLMGSLKKRPEGYHLLNMNVDRLEFGYCRETNDG